MPAGSVSFLMENGATFDQVVFWKDSNGQPIDLTGYTVQVLVKNPNTGQTYNNTQITVTPLQGKIELVIPNTDTATLLENEYLFELQVTSPSSFVTRLLQGRLKTSASFF